MIIRAVDFKRIVVRPIRADERSEFDRLLVEQHYLKSSVLVGEALRYVATEGGRWLALLGWCTAAFKCKPRDSWIGWPSHAQWRRLRLIANNGRFLMLPEARQANLASRILALNCRRLSEDWRITYGHPILLAETFVESARFAGTCYRAAGWTLLGETKGFGRNAGIYYRHGVHKRIFIKPLYRDSRTLLCDPHPHPEWNSEERAMDPLLMKLIGPGSMYEAFQGVTDPRDRQGCSYRDFAGLLVLILSGALAGRRTCSGIARWVKGVPDEIARALGCVRDARTGRCLKPSLATIRRAVLAADGNEIDCAFGKWALENGVDLEESTIAIDGKFLCGSYTDDPKKKVGLLAALTTREGVVIAQQQIEDKSNEIPAAKAMLSRLESDLKGKRVTISLDALHTQKETAEMIAGMGLFYILQVKDNQPTLSAHIRDYDWSGFRADSVEVDRGHGRKEKRSIRVIGVPEDDSLPGFPSAKLMFMIFRERETLKGEVSEPEAAIFISNWPKQEIKSRALAGHTRRHWGVENKLHYVRDVTFDEDRSRMRTGNGPRVMASLRNIAIGIFRLRGASNIQAEVDFCCQDGRRCFSMLCGRKGRKQQAA